MGNHFIVRLSVVFITLSILALTPAMLPAKEKVATKGPAPLVNINTASEAQLAELPGIGPSIAERIVRYRQETGPFKTPEDVKRIKGIGDKTYIKFKHLIIADHSS